MFGKKIWEIYINNHKHFDFFHLNPPNKLLSILAIKRPLRLKYPSLCSDLPVDAKNIVVHITIICSIQEAEILRCSSALDACGRHEDEDQSMIESSSDGEGGILGE